MRSGLSAVIVCPSLNKHVRNRTLDLAPCQETMSFSQPWAAMCELRKERAMSVKVSAVGVSKREFLKAILAGCAAATASPLAAESQTARFRPPAVPLIVTDPYFSIWSVSDNLNDSATQHWTGRAHRLTSFLRIDRDVYRLMGSEPKGMPALRQTSLTVYPTRSVYQFENAQVSVTLTFMTAALPFDLTVFSRPLGYVTWSVRATDGKQHDVAVHFDAAPEIAVNEASQRVRWSDESANGLISMRTGCAEQITLNPKGDDVRIDWGYLYLAAPTQAGVTHAIAHAGQVWDNFERSGALHAGASSHGEMAVDDGAPSLAVSFSLGAVRADAVSRTALLAYDEIFAIQYFEENLRPYWRRSGATASDLLRRAADEYESLKRQCEQFDRELIADATALGGPKYADICALAYRQCVAANKLVTDANGQPLLFPKENTSNGCIGTVDVIYPMSPQFLLFGPSLSKAMLISNLQYASSPRWKFPFAPHDLGTYPQADGQVYGGGEKTEEDQMPVEETGNMLILLTALAQMEGNADFVTAHWPTIQKWAEYLKVEGYNPKNQLSTDDFAGHLAHNVNLSGKAIIALGAYSVLCEMRNQKQLSAEYLQLAKSYAAKWVQQANGGDHFGLTFDAPSATWSQKYNLVWDRILGLNLFPDSALQKEVAFYKGHLQKYGLPLDSRKLWTKLDWTLWSATLTVNRDDFDTFTDVVWRFLNETPDRVPMSDFYWTDDGYDAGMHARSVVGGVFLRFLYDRELWKKWAARDRTKAKGWAALPASALTVT